MPIGVEPMLQKMYFREPLIFDICIPDKMQKEYIKPDKKGHECPHTYQSKPIADECRMSQDKRNKAKSKRKKRNKSKKNRK